MIIFGIDPGVSGAISILENKKVIDIFDMPTMIDGKKNKRQVNGSQVTNIIKDKLNTWYIFPQQCFTYFLPNNILLLKFFSAF